MNCKIPSSSRYPTRFKKGDKVLCTAGVAPRLVKGSSYIVVMAVAMKNGFESIWLESDSIGGTQYAFMATRFEKLGEKEVSS